MCTLHIDNNHYVFYIFEHFCNLSSVKVKISDFKPLILTEVSYKKIMGSVLKRMISRFVEENKLLKEEQTGFTRRKRMEENLVVVQLEVESAIVKGRSIYM